MAVSSSDCDWRCGVGSRVFFLRLRVISTVLIFVVGLFSLLRQVCRAERPDVFKHDYNWDLSCRVSSAPCISPRLIFSNPEAPVSIWLNPDHSI